MSNHHITTLISRTAAAIAADDRATAAERDVVLDFVRTAPLPGLRVKRIRTDLGRIVVEVTKVAKVPGNFPGSTVRSPEAKGSIAAIATAAPTRRVEVRVI